MFVSRIVGCCDLCSVYIWTCVVLCIYIGLFFACVVYVFRLVDVVGCVVYLSRLADAVACVVYAYRLLPVLCLSLGSWVF